MINKNTRQNHDFYEALYRVGVPLKDEWSPRECCLAANAWLHDSGKEELQSLIEALKAFEEETPEISAEIKEAIVQIRGEHVAH